MTDLNTIISNLNNHKTFIKEEIYKSSTSHAPTKKLIDFLFELKINLALVPQKFGGLGFDLFEEYVLIKESAQINPSFGFIVFQLCGNVGRVLSFLTDNEIISLIKKHDSRIIFAYQNNFNIGKFKLIGKDCYIEGKWNIASLTSCATHFVLPYKDNSGKKKCIIIEDRNKIKIPKNSKGIGLKATSTTGYLAENIKVTQEKFNIEAVSKNSNFLPNYSIPRSAIKHFAWTTGCFFYLNQLSPINKKIINPIINLEKNISNKIVGIQNSLENITDAEYRLNFINTVNVSFNSFLLELSLSEYLNSSTLAINEKSLITQFLCDILTMSLHGAVKEKTSSWCEEDSNKLISLLKYV